MLAYANEEMGKLEKRLTEVEEDLKVLLLPKDPNDEKNVILEIRAGTGGDEATLFAAEIFRMYTRYAESQRWKVEVLSTSESGVGGLKEVIAIIEGQRVYSRLKYESGVHRVQRVPADRNAGPRAHLGRNGRGAARSRRRGHQDRGQGHSHRHLLLVGPGRPVGEHDVLGGAHHAPADQHRGQLPGREVADQEPRERACACCAPASTRWSSRSRPTRWPKSARPWSGAGDRSEKIRTYNFPQNRVTDHRIGFTAHQLPEFMDGRIQPMIDALITHFQSEKLKQESA